MNRFRFQGPLSPREAADLTRELIAIGLSVTTQYKGRGIWHIFGMREGHKNGNPPANAA